MNTSTHAWLESLKERAQANRLEHLDLLIDATALQYPLLNNLQALNQPPAQALLLEGLPEAALAEQGPILLRISLATTAQWQWLSEVDETLLSQQRLLALLSAWPFADLAQHLSQHLQAEWNQGRSSGLLRYYDPRLFLAICDMLDPQQSAQFHAPVITWHWLDRDGAPALLPGMPRSPSTLQQPLPPLQLSNPQVASLVAWTGAELLCRDYALQPQDYGLAKQESLIRHLVHGQLAADRAGCFDATRDNFVLDWLAQNSATAPARAMI
ncbi:DUF4123 domain-containing protein [Pseudomonas xionganensis]|uniref:DUF4123 domain-containing protein n=1 Tax=Pseudomonas xionganensis TaxID=2654845 RepID=A0A6I4KMT5_9PSED|nr:DUF4123 domain-containing protein [Pseudomonas xionganensis]MVW73969.1 DUF4123 domain-containing protein [Pseudomonas xionganensis]